MKTIVLLSPAVIAGAVRYPVEGALVVRDADAERLIEANMADEVDEDGNVVEHPDGLDDMLVADLNTLATKEGVALNGATKKDDIIAAIRVHRAGNGS